MCGTYLCLMELIFCSFWGFPADVQFFKCLLILCVILHSTTGHKFVRLNCPQLLLYMCPGLSNILQHSTGTYQAFTLFHVSLTYGIPIKITVIIGYPSSSTCAGKINSCFRGTKRHHLLLYTVLAILLSPSLHFIWHNHPAIICKTSN